jgi:hypothetical protein
VDDKTFLIWLAANLESPQFGNETRQRLIAIAAVTPVGSVAKADAVGRLIIEIPAPGMRTSDAVGGRTATAFGIA